MAGCVDRSPPERVQLTLPGARHRWLRGAVRRHGVLFEPTAKRPPDDRTTTQHRTSSSGNYFAYDVDDPERYVVRDRNIVPRSAGVHPVPGRLRGSGRVLLEDRVRHVRSELLLPQRANPLRKHDGRRRQPAFVRYKPILHRRRQRTEHLRCHRGSMMGHHWFEGRRSKRSPSSELSEQLAPRKSM